MGKNKISGSSLAITVLIIITAWFFMISCTRSRSRENIGTQGNIEIQGNIVEIRERMFLTQIRDIYLNANEFLERPIKLEGIFRIDIHEDVTIYSVIRYIFGCCGDDGLVGFEVKWARANAREFPAENSWVEASGVLKQYGHGVDRFLYIELSTLTVLDRRGAEFVTR